LIIFIRRLNHFRFHRRSTIIIMYFTQILILKHLRNSSTPYFITHLRQNITITFILSINRTSIFHCHLRLYFLILILVKIISIHFNKHRQSYSPTWSMLIPFSLSLSHKITLILKELNHIRWHLYTPRYLHNNKNYLDSLQIIIYFL
jgi:hypothetical protein